MRPLFLVLLVFWTIPEVRAHEVRPGYLELRQKNADSYDVLWKIPAVGEMRLALYPQLPESCRTKSEPIRFQTTGAYVERASFSCAGGLDRRRITINGLTATLTDVLVRLERLDGTSQVARLTPSAPSFVVEGAPRRLDVARTYLALGIEHILTGVDHLLFVSGLLLLVSGFGRLVKTISAFTLSHSVTLSLATLGYVHAPPAPVEAVIALSILFVACEILRGPQQPLSVAQRKPWLVAFAFGLLHGLGFAGGLSEAGLPDGHIPLALALFSAGVEIGHFSFVAVVLVLIRLWQVASDKWFAPFITRHPLLDPRYRMRLVPPYAIGSVAAYWVIQRIAAF